MRNVFFLMIALTFLLSSRFAVAFDCPPTGSTSLEGLVENEASKSKSEIIRDNTPNYALNFNCLNGKLENPSLREIFSAKGYIFGDNHPGNWTLGPIANKLEFFMADLDDAGVGSFILDINRLLLSTFAVGMDNKSVNINFQYLATILFQEYLLGLEGNQKTPSEYIQSKTSLNINEYVNIASQFADKKSEGNRFRLSPDDLFEVKPLSLKNSIMIAVKKTLSRSSPELKSSVLLDIALRPKDRGGSKDLLRYWALVQISNRKQIIEFKELAPSAASLVYPQEPIKTLFGKMKSALWPNTDLNYLITVINGGNFVMRPKKIKTDLVVPYSQSNSNEYLELIEYSKYVAHLTGLAHGKQAGSKQFKTLLKSNLNETLEILWSFNKAYLKMLPVTKK